jgi:hypothetical protein
VVSTFILRLLGHRLEHGEFVGQVEHIATGEIATVHNVEELAAFARTAEESATVELREERQ